MKYLLQFTLTLLTYAMCDLAWLNIFAKKFIQQEGETSGAKAGFGRCRHILPDFYRRLA